MYEQWYLSFSTLSLNELIDTNLDFKCPLWEEQMQFLSSLFNISLGQRIQKLKILISWINLLLFLAFDFNTRIAKMFSWSREIASLWWNDIENTYLEIKTKLKRIKFKIYPLLSNKDGKNDFMKVISIKLR